MANIRAEFLDVFLATIGITASAKKKTHVTSKISTSPCEAGGKLEMYSGLVVDLITADAAICGTDMR
jgi:hypothetical protein